MNTKQQAMSGKTEISVVIPLYNEEDNVEELVGKVCDSLEKIDRPWELILVDDGSIDGTMERLRAAASGRHSIKVISLARHFGQTAALATGFDYATGEVIVPMDGDLQNDPDDIPMLVEHLDRGYDVVSGWRRERHDNYLLRRMPSTLANLMISKLSGITLHDYGCTLKAYRKSMLKHVKLYGEMHRFIPILANWQGARVTELPVRHHSRTRGKSKYGLGRTFKVLLDMMVLKFLDGFFTKPMYIFGGFGLFCLALSLIFLFTLMHLKFTYDVSMILTPLPTLAGMTFLIGMTSLLMGLLAEIVVRTYFESQDKKIYDIRETINIPGE